jgi:hypothetical protein
MNPVRESFSLSLNSNDITVQTERYHESQEHAEYEETLRAALDGDRPRLLVHRHCTAVRAQLVLQIPFRQLFIRLQRCRRCRHSFHSSVVSSSAANQYKIKKCAPQISVSASPSSSQRRSVFSSRLHSSLCSSLCSSPLHLHLQGHSSVEALGHLTPLLSINLVALPKIRGQTSTTTISSASALLAKWAAKSPSRKLRSRRLVALRRRITHGPSSTYISHAP